MWIPFIVILLLAGLQALPDGREGSRQGRRRQSLAVVLGDHLSADAAGERDGDHAAAIIFELKLADIVINVTAGGPGGATDTISSFVYREYRDRSNVGYATMVAEVYLVIIIVFVTLLLKAVSRFMQKMT